MTVRRFFRKLHRYVGLSIAVFIVSLAVTGFLLNHPELLGDRHDAEGTLALAIDPVHPDRRFRGTPGGLLVTGDGGASWREVPMLVPVENVVAVAFAPDDPREVWVAGADDGLVRSVDGGVVWEPVDLGFVPALEGVRIERLALGPGGLVVVGTSDGELVSVDGRTFGPSGDGVPPGRGAHALVHDLHTGYLAGRWLVLAHDAAAIGAVLLVVSGFLIWRGRQGQNGRGRAADLVRTERARSSREAHRSIR